MLTVNEQVAVFWAAKPHKNLDWLKFEDTLRNVLREYRQHHSAVVAIKDIDEVIASFTRRGNELD